MNEHEHIIDAALETYPLVDLPPGPLTLRAYHADWAASEDLHLELQPGQHWPGVNVSLRRGGRLRSIPTMPTAMVC